RSDGVSTTFTSGIGRSSSHSAADACRSASTSTTGVWPRDAATAARYTAVVVLPTPPLRFVTTTFTGRTSLLRPVDADDVCPLARGTSPNPEPLGRLERRLRRCRLASGQLERRAVRRPRTAPCCRDGPWSRDRDRQLGRGIMVCVAGRTWRR